LPAPEGGVRLLRARAGAARLRALPGLAGLRCEQSFRPEFEQLLGEGLEVVDGLQPPAAQDAWVLALPPRQKDEARALLARMAAACAPGGRLLCSVANDEGAKSLEKDFERLFGVAGALAKHHCRVFWSGPFAGARDPALLAQWGALDAPRPILGGRYLGRPGVFAWDRIDPASRLLAEALPADLRGEAADLGAGWGFLSDALLERCPGVTSLDAYEAEARALEPLRRNLAGHAGRRRVDAHWHDVAAGLPRRFDLIVSNPPFHALGRGDRPDLGRRFIEVAAAALVPGGQCWLVANRHLPYEATLQARFAQVRVAAQGQGFKVIAAAGARAWA
ncbi:MAG: class I SAM-dependent methyltransferase, partial [Pseudoxanthomonas sp.]